MQELLNDLKNIYKADIDTEVTVIEFEIIKKFDEIDVRDT